MSDNHAHARTREAARRWLGGYLDDQNPNRGGTVLLPDQFPLEVIIAAFAAGADWSADLCGTIHREEQDLWHERFGVAGALISKASALFRSYEAQHRDRAARWRHQMHGPDSLRKTQADIDDTLAEAERNAAMAAELEAWLVGGNPTNALRLFAERMVDGETIKAVDHANFDEAARHLAEVQHMAEGGPLTPEEIEQAVRPYLGLHGDEEQPQRIYSREGNVHPLYSAENKYWDNKEYDIDDGGIERWKSPRYGTEHRAEIFQGRKPSSEPNLREIGDRDDLAAMISLANMAFPTDTSAGVSTISNLCETTFGREVRKDSGDYVFDGEVRGVALKRSGAVRYVVEDDRGLLLIMNASQCGIDQPEPDPPAANIAKAEDPGAMRLKTGDPSFNPAEPVYINGFRFNPTKEN